jgi:hypothetical protein
MRIFAVALLTVLIAALSYFIAFFIVRDLLRQHFAESFPHVQGTVLSSQVTKSYGSKGRVYYHPHVTYRYTVDGSEYTGYRYRYDGHPSGYTSAYEIVNSHPAGSAVEVYYNPADATDSLLSPGVDRPDIALGFFVGAIVLFLWYIPLKGAQQPNLPWTGPDATGGVKVITEMTVTRLRMPRYPPAIIAVIATAILMFLAAAVIGLGLLSTPLWITGQCALAIVIVGGTAVYAWQYLDVRSGRRDLVIDEAGRTVQLPLTYGRREQTTVPNSEIRAVLLNKVRHQRKGGAYYTYMVTLKMTDGSRQKLIDLNMTRADSLGTWLKEKLGLPEHLNEPAEDQLL